MIDPAEASVGEYYWILVAGPGSESTHDYLEIATIDEIDKDGGVETWLTMMGTVAASRVRRIVQHIEQPNPFEVILDR